MVMLPVIHKLDQLAATLADRGVCLFTGHSINAASDFRAADTFLRGLDACPKLEERTMFPESLKQLPEAKRRVLQHLVGRTASVAPPEGAPDLSGLANGLKGLAHQAIECIATHFKLSDKTREGLLRDDEWALSTAHYPFEAGKKGKMLFPAHKDWGTLAIYPFLEGAGLEGNTGNGWFPIEVPSGALLIYAGDILERLTWTPNQTGVAALLHRVVQPTDEPTGRTSMIFYVDTWRDMQLPLGGRCQGQFVREIIEEKLRKIGQVASTST